MIIFFFGYVLLTVTNTYSYLGMLLSERGKFDVWQEKLRIVVLGIFSSCIQICIIYTILKYIANVNYLIKLLYEFVTTSVRYGDFIKLLLYMESIFTFANVFYMVRNLLQIILLTVNWGDFHWQ